MKKGVLSVLLVVLMVFSCFNTDVLAATSFVPNITYSSHVQNIGWMSAVKDGQTSGTTGKGYRLEAMKINLTQNGTSMIQYRAHVQNVGWQNWVNSGTTIGTTGKSYRMEALEIKLKGAYANNYDIYYRVHVAKLGWLGWAKNGKTAGSTGIGAQIEAVQIKLLKKGDTSLNSSIAASINPTLTYKAHVADIGWMSTVSQDQVSGTTGQTRRLEAFVINLKDPFGNSNIQYKAHVSNIGWQDWKTSGNVGGTIGQSKAVEAIQVQLTGALSVYYDVYYRVHTSTIGWLGWAKNGAYAGTTGGGLAVEAIQVKIVPKGTNVNTGGVAYYDKRPITTVTNSTTGFDPIWPCANTYTITTLYKYSSGSVHSCRFKYGIDIGAPIGEKVLAVEAGTVICSEYSTSSGFGNWIMIRHWNGKVSLYAHLSSRKVSVGDIVSKGQIIGQVGNSSAKSSIAAHLHFELGNSNTFGAAGDSYQEYYKAKYANKIVLTQAAQKYRTP